MCANPMFIFYTTLSIDIDGDGQLDEAELAMRRMDTSGRGYLTNEKVLGLMTEQLAQQRQLFKLKKVIIGLAAVVVRTFA